jgi:quercetin dioxygenase-like cupin family protein
MKNPKLMLAAASMVAGVIGAWGIGSLEAQDKAAAFKRTPLQKHDLTAHGREGVQVLAEFAPGAAAGKHTHPGEEMGYILEGTLQLEIEGKPPVTLKAGQAFFVPANTVHDGKNVGKGPLKVLATYIVEKGKPVASAVKP